MEKRGFSLYVILFLIVGSTMAVLQFYDNTTSLYNLHIEYQVHRCTASGSGMYFTFDHTYSTITIDTQVYATNIEGSISGTYVFGVPFWIDISSWNVGDNITIAGAEYELSLQSGKWRAHRDFGEGEYENLFYNKDLGIFVGSYVDHMSLDYYGFSGYTRDIEIEQSNLSTLYGRITGMNILSHLGLLFGIFIELAVIQYVLEQRKARPSKSSP